MVPNSKRFAGLASGLRAYTWDLRSGELDGRKLKRYVKRASNRQLRRRQRQKPLEDA